MHRVSRERGSLGVILLVTQMFNMGLGNIPPVTLSLVGLQAAVFMRMLPQYFGSAASVCMSTYLVWTRQDWKRMILSQFYHADDMHLYFNMASLLVKGRSLEKRFGSFYFAFLVAVFTALTSVFYIAINLVLEERMDDQWYATQCAVGFSGVLFALKVVTTHYAPHVPHYALGFIPVPSRYIYWAELIIISFITPNSSFTGHLAGILAGLLYIKGPLKPAMDAIFAPAPESRFTGTGQATGYRGSGWFSSGTQTPYNRPYTPHQPSEPHNSPSSQDHSKYTGGLSEEEQLRRALHESQRQHEEQLNHRHWNYNSNTNNHPPQQPQPSAPPPPPGLYPDLEELRSRRVAQYQ